MYVWVLADTTMNQYFKLTRGHSLSVSESRSASLSCSQGGFNPFVESYIMDGCASNGYVHVSLCRRCSSTWISDKIYAWRSFKELCCEETRDTVDVLLSGEETLTSNSTRNSDIFSNIKHNFKNQFLWLNEDTVSAFVWKKSLRYLCSRCQKDDCSVRQH